MARRRFSPLDRVLGRIDDLDAQNLAILARRLERERDLMETVLDTLREGVIKPPFLPLVKDQPNGGGKLNCFGAAACHSPRWELHPSRPLHAEPHAVEQCHPMWTPRRAPPGMQSL
jgi:hypothetical protein